MPQKPKRVLVLYDLPERVTDHDQPNYLLNHDDRPTERDVTRAIKRLGLDLHVHGVFDDIVGVWRKIQFLTPDLVFNLCETFRGNRTYEGDIASVLELTGVPYTGSGPAALHLCKDKGATKKIAIWDGIKVPRFKVYRKDEMHFEPFAASFPLIVKPLNREASEGISQASIVYDWKSCEARASWLALKFGADVIVEEFIHGRELYVGVFDTSDGLIALPPRELFFANMAKSDPMVATYRAKWDDRYRKKWGITTGRAAAMTRENCANIMNLSMSLFKSLGLRGYARFDWRLNTNNEPVFLEANPNPALAQEDDFAKAAKTTGYSYGELIASISNAAVHQLNQRNSTDLNQLNPRWSATTRPMISKVRSSA